MYLFSVWTHLEKMVQYTVTIMRVLSIHTLVRETHTLSEWHTHQHSKGNDLQHTLHGEQRRENYVQVSQDSFIGWWSSVLLNTQTQTHTHTHIHTQACTHTKTYKHTHTHNHTEAYKYLYKTHKYFHIQVHKKRTKKTYMDTQIRTWWHKERWTWSTPHRNTGSQGQRSRHV